MDADMKRHMEVKKREDRARELVQELVDLCNVNGKDNQRAITMGIVDGIQYSHRTLQQSFCRVLRDSLLCYSASTQIDARNEAGVDWAAQAGASDTILPFI